MPTEDDYIIVSKKKLLQVLGNCSVCGTQAVVQETSRTTPFDWATLYAVQVVGFVGIW